MVQHCQLPVFTLDLIRNSDGTLLAPDALFPAKVHTLSHPDTAVHREKSNNSPPIHICLRSADSFSPSLCFASLPERHLPHSPLQALHLCGLSALFFIWLVATGGSTLADYNSAASHFRFIIAPPSVPPLCQPSTLTTPASIHPHTHRNSLLCSLLPPLSPSFHQCGKFSLQAPKQKKKDENSAVEAFKLERQQGLYYYLGLCHWG